ncbi:putative lipoprotein [Caballeronia sordidicola]|uniref:Putative lipoprotein n=1 Tax=Caballeronia sordidicola TaxID=196367 RepID=A0A158FHQ8_CABSO|nr:HNH endonuclease [Caballeronia sordidicola]SAL18580.1 putative lipoprotein [Caballeronia sordidicola]
MTKQSTSKRDDFPGKVKLDLAKRVNFRCSICDNHTAGPKSGSDAPIYLGRAAHIKAAAPGGPRYDPEQTREERRSIANGIFACPHCADLIDQDDSAYSVADLVRFKQVAENRARERLDRHPVEEAIASKSLTQINRAVQLYCLNEEERLEQLDSRFSTSVTWGEHGPVHEMRAREPIAPRITMNGEDRHAVLTAIRDVLDYGGSRSFENVDIKLEGSPVFAEVDGVVKRFAISTEVRESTLSVAFGSSEEDAVVVDFIGEISGGALGYRIGGSAYDGLLRVELQYDRATRDVNVKLHFGLDRWSRKPLLRLPHFPKLMQFSRALRKRTDMKLALTTADEEREICRGRLDAGDASRHLHAFLTELQFLRKIDAFFGLDVRMPEDVDDVLRGAGEHDEILALVDIHESQEQGVTMTLVPNESVNELVLAVQNHKPNAVKLTQKVDINLFGQRLGPYDVDVECPNVVVMPVGPVTMQASVPVQLQMKAVEGARWTARKA